MCPPISGSSDPNSENWKWSSGGWGSTKLKSVLWEGTSLSHLLSGKVGEEVTSKVERKGKGRTGGPQKRGPTVAVESPVLQEGAPGVGKPGDAELSSVAGSGGPFLICDPRFRAGVCDPRRWSSWGPPVSHREAHIQVSRSRSSTQTATTSKCHTGQWLSRELEGQDSTSGHRRIPWAQALR